MTELFADLEERLERKAETRTRLWWEKYLRGTARFRGVKMGDVRTALHAWWTDYHLAEVLSREEQAHLAFQLIEHPLTEDKLAGVLLIQELLIPADIVTWSAHERVIARLFDDGHLADWNSVDWFCVKALAALVGKDGPEAARGLLTWSEAKVLWRARASIVPFANTSGKPDQYFDGFEEALLAACGTLIRRPERFSKTAVGWVLREFATVRPSHADRFIEEHLPDFTPETIRNVTKRMDPPRARRHLSAFGARQVTSLGSLGA